MGNENNDQKLRKRIDWVTLILMITLITVISTVAIYLIKY